MSIIFLNGCTSAGKSSIARELQARLPAPHLSTGIDDAFAMLPVRYHNHPDGFFFDRDARDLVRLNFGGIGLATLRAHHRSAAAIAHSGVDLILDEVVLDRSLLVDWVGALDGLQVVFVAVRCDLDELERREIARGDRVVGQARGQFEIVHAHTFYDIEVDTTRASAAEAADHIVRALGAGGDWRAMQCLKAAIRDDRTD